MDPVLLNKLAEQSPIVVFMAVLLYVAYKYVSRTLDKQDEREDAREARYNAMVDKLVDVQTTALSASSAAINNNTAVMQRVERKLDV